MTMEGEGMTEEEWKVLEGATKRMAEALPRLPEGWVLDEYFAILAAYRELVERREDEE